METASWMKFLKKCQLFKNMNSNFQEDMIYSMGGFKTQRIYEHLPSKTFVFLSENIKETFKTGHKLVALWTVHWTQINGLGLPFIFDVFNVKVPKIQSQGYIFWSCFPSCSSFRIYEPMSEDIENLNWVLKNRILAYNSPITLWCNFFKKWY